MTWPHSPRSGGAVARASRVETTLALLEAPAQYEKGYGDVRTTPRSQCHHRPGREPAARITAHDLQPHPGRQAVDDPHNWRVAARARFIPRRQQKTVVDRDQVRQLSERQLPGILNTVRFDKEWVHEVAGKKCLG